MKERAEQRDDWRHWTY